MTEYKLGDIEMRFADLLWEHEPISSGEIVKPVVLLVRLLLKKAPKIFSYAL